MRVSRDKLVKRRRRTRVRSHRRRTPSGGYTTVRSHNRNYWGAAQRPIFQVRSRPILKVPPRPPKISQRTMNMLLKVLNLKFPQYAPIIESGRLLYANRELFIPLLKSILNKKDTQKQIEIIESKIINRIEKRFINSFSRQSANFISNKIEETGFFSKTLSKILPQTGMDVSNDSVIKHFFTNTLEDLISYTSMGVLSGE